jgi:hypothetical protein
MAFGGSKSMHFAGKISEVTIFRALWHLGSFCGLFQQALIKLKNLFA